MSTKVMKADFVADSQTVVGQTVSASQAAAVIELAQLHSQATRCQAETAKALGELHETVAQIAWNTHQAASELRNIEKECYFMEGRSDAASRTMTDIGRQLCPVCLCAVLQAFSPRLSVSSAQFARQLG